MGHLLGPRLRALRAASGRTVAAVATDAGLSVPYVANLENGRGNPTVDALTRLAEALGTTLTVEFAEHVAEPAELPAALVRLGRTTAFRRDAAALAEATGQDPAELPGRLLDVLARLAALTGRDLAEPDWLRLLDALLLITLHPRGRGRAPADDATGARPD
ncbi:helix-turn-helix domain-containing protein [Saccharothrix syringae]|uniref:XRE family transcriptional regulator n=1 Tax=Saccharothrix syringae TaxID=103733 RepID=A0A5Q0H5Z4_SACSY|nr:helix-turn-helix transcriptional regulator [Saccharothrix syringae]QFZ21335.1 XRE family transcriptional regulator [Saccharothrix syringae]